LALLFVGAFGLLTSWPDCLPFAVGLYGSMIMDHRLHILFHKRERLGGVLGWFQKMHLIHHSTHNSNYFFVSGLIWDVLLGTARTPSEPARPRIGVFTWR
jgi:sterol desaturase/sphingolipid hydroxylase (fatty acid hydroxylase superfamily)